MVFEGLDHLTRRWIEIGRSGFWLGCVGVGFWGYLDRGLELLECLGWEFLVNNWEEIIVDGKERFRIEILVRKLKRTEWDVCFLIYRRIFIFFKYKMFGNFILMIFEDISSITLLGFFIAVVGCKPKIFLTSEILFVTSSQIRSFQVKKHKENSI